MTPEWVQAIIKEIDLLLPVGFVGKLEVNCVNGHVGNLVVNQSFKKGENST